jgi:hypothetical protein
MLGAPAAADDAAAADALFRRGVADMEAGRFDAACPAIAESNRLDPTPGTLFTLADCEAKAGRIMTAVALFDDYLLAFSRMSDEAQQKHLTRAGIARSQKAALTPEIPAVTLTLPASSPENVRITLDGAELTRASLGVALPMNPGEHVVTVQTPDGSALNKYFTLERRQKRSIELDALPSPEPPVAPSATPAASAAPTVRAAALAPTSTRLSAPRPIAPPKPASSESGQRAAAYVVGAVGLAGFVVGGVTGGLAMERKQVSDEHCSKAGCTKEGKAAGETAFAMSIVSSAGFGVGVAGAVVSIALFLTAPRTGKGPSAPGDVRAHVIKAGPDAAILGVKGAF